MSLQVCVYALLVLKTAQQAFLDSLPLFTVSRFVSILYQCSVELGLLTLPFPNGACFTLPRDMIL